MDTNTELNNALREHFLNLPEVVQKSILSTNIEGHLREMSGRYKLHLDQWQTLENEVMLALLGIKNASDLPVTISAELHMSEADALNLSKDISQTIFEPIRAEMERALGAPQAQEETHSDIENIRTELLSQEKTTLLSEHTVPQTEPNAPKLFSATPPAPQPTVASIKTEIAPEMRTGTSAERKVIANDLYREQL